MWGRTRENDGLHTVVLSEFPDEQFGEIARVDELAQRLARAANNERRVVLYQTRQEKCLSRRYRVDALFAR